MASKDLDSSDVSYSSGKRSLGAKESKHNEYFDFILYLNCVNFICSLIFLATLSKLGEFISDETTEINVDPILSHLADAWE